MHQRYIRQDNGPVAYGEPLLVGPNGRPTVGQGSRDESIDTWIALGLV